MPKIQFFVACVPPTATHHRKKIVRAGRFTKLADSPELVAAINNWTAMIQPHRPAAAMAGPVALTLEFTWPWLGSTSKAALQAGRVPKWRKPDCSNMAKSVEDVLVLLRFIEDDGQVAQLVVRKFHGEEPGLLVRIETMEGY